MNFTILGTLCKWNLSVFDLLCLVYFISLSMLSSRFIHAVNVSEFPFLRMKNTLLCVYTPHFVFPFIYQLALRVASTFWRLWTMLLWAQVYKHLFKTQLSVLLGTSPEVELLDHAVILCFIFFFEELPYFFHSSCTILDSHLEWTEFQMFHIVASSCCFLICFWW